MKYFSGLFYFLVMILLSSLQAQNENGKREDIRQ